jgi:hypothetical protein
MEVVQTNQSAESDSGHTEEKSPLDLSETKLAAVADRSARGASRLASGSFDGAFTSMLRLCNLL